MDFLISGAPVAEDAANTLEIFNYLVAEQELRYEEFKRVGVENIKEYNHMFPDYPMPRIVSFTKEEGRGKKEEEPTFKKVGLK